MPPTSASWEAEHEAQAIIAGAKTEAERLAVEAETNPGVRRAAYEDGRKQISGRGAGLADVRSAAAEAAVAAAERILTHTVKGKVADDLIVKGIADLKGKLN